LSFRSRRSLAFTVAAILLVMSTAVLGLSAAVAFRALQLRETRALNRRADLTTRTLAEALVLPLWNLDEEQTNRILEGALADRVIVGLRVRTRYGDQARFRPGVPQGPADLMARAGFLVQSREIRRGQASLGTLEAFTTTRFMDQDMNRLKMVLFAGLLGFDLVLVAGMYLLLWMTVVKPIREASRFAEAVSSGRLPFAPVEAGHRFLELEGLHRSMATMVQLLNQRYVKLMESEQRFRALFNGSNDAIFVREIVPGNPRAPFVEVNEAACALLGYSREDLLTRNVYDLSPARLEDSLDRARKALSAQGNVLVDGVHLTRDGREIQVEINAHQFELAGRTFVLSVARDVSERHRLEEQLRHSQKMESVGMLAGGIAHDFNNILQVIIGYANTLEVKIPEQDPNRRHLDPILAAAGRAAQLTRSLLAFSRKESIEPRPAELNELVRRMHEFLKRVIGEDIELVTRQSPVSLDVLIDEGQIEQVLMNLATNARDAMPKGGILSLETERVAIAPDAIGQHGVDHAGTWARLSVSDTGSGMDEVTRLRMFDPFFTTKAAGKGTGLGLAIVYGIIRQHRGQINAYSEPGRGTTFRIYLPVAGEGALAAEQAAPSAAGLGGAETILVAEDDESLRLLFSDILTGQGYSVIQAGDGQEAVERHREHAGKVDLLLMDLIMPRMSGKAAFDLIRAACPTVRVLFTSGYTADIIQSRADLDEGVDLVMKPIATRDLLMKIRSILDRT